MTLYFNLDNLRKIQWSRFALFILTINHFSHLIPPLSLSLSLYIYMHTHTDLVFSNQTWNFKSFSLILLETTSLRVYTYIRKCFMSVTKARAYANRSICPLCVAYFDQRAFFNFIKLIFWCNINLIKFTWFTLIY